MEKKNEQARGLIHIYCGDGTVKGRKSDGMGSENEQYTSVCEGDCGERDYS